jgi:hypothetical protein
MNDRQNLPGTRSDGNKGKESAQSVGPKLRSGLSAVEQEQKQEEQYSYGSKGSFHTCFSLLTEVFSK